MATEYMDYTEYGRPLPRSVVVLARLIAAADRETILGDLLEDAEFRGLRGARRAAWLAGECAAIAAGLSVERVRGWVVVAPAREVFAGLAIDGRSVLRGGAGATALRALIFVGSMTTLVLGAELLVGSLLSAAGF